MYSFCTAGPRPTDSIMPASCATLSPRRLANAVARLPSTRPWNLSSSAC